MHTLYAIVIVYVLLELFEIQWQKADTMMKMMLRLYRRYQKSVIGFLVLHPTYYFAIWLTLATHYSAAAVTVLLIKSIDIVVKIIMIRMIFEKRELSQELTLMLLTPLHPMLPYFTLLIYTPMVILALL